MDAITSEVGRTTGFTMVRTTATPITAGLSRGAGDQESNPVTTMFEHILASLARFETRMDDFDRRLVPPRSESSQSYGLPSHWFTDAMPKTGQVSIPTQSVVMSIPTHHRSSWERPGSGSAMAAGNHTIGSAAMPSSMPSILGSFGLGSQANSGRSTTWEPPGLTQGMGLPLGRAPTSWDNPMWHNQGGQR